MEGLTRYLWLGAKKQAGGKEINLIQNNKPHKLSIKLQWD